MSTDSKVVFFDVGNTLLFPDWDHILEPLSQRGVSPTREQLQATERKAKREFDDLVVHGTVDRRFWAIFYSRLLESLGIADEPLKNTLTAATGISANWNRIRPGTREILQRIAKRHRIGVISNADGRIAQALTACEICDCFLTITDSGLLGREKPHPHIFETAARQMDVRAGDALYVGDVFCVDYAGATSAGMQAILFDVCGAYRDTGLPRVESLEQLERRLALP